MQALILRTASYGAPSRPEKGDLTGPNPVDRGKYGSKIQLVTERTGLPLSVGISGDPGLHDRACPPARGRGPQKGAPADEPGDHAIGRSRGGLTMKIHLAADGRCRPLAFVLTAGQAGDAPGQFRLDHRTDQRKMPAMCSPAR
ncbi:hypothetical protein GCM10010503_39220 [Streptomyces lucensis JCM 4490]|uniref:Transposase n=1 Tax=Streptomyces lucensis JCM 4490 TaxID=1306176 RepID=A0A918MRE5_9ACTN|nr:hypothetical protein GCM10010503_39220 [Streptomyces lucensis JCM 4490]